MKMENLSLMQSNLLCLGIFLIVVVALLLLTWLKIRREECKLNRDAWYASMLVNFRKGCWVRDINDDAKRYHITGCSEYDNEVYLTTYIYYPDSGGKKKIDTEMWALDYVMSKLYLNELIILEDVK